MLPFCVFRHSLHLSAPSLSHSLLSHLGSRPCEIKSLSSKCLGGKAGQCIGCLEPNKSYFMSVPAIRHHASSFWYTIRVCFGEAERETDCLGKSSKSGLFFPPPTTTVLLRTNNGMAEATHGNMDHHQSHLNTDDLIRLYKETTFQKEKKPRFAWIESNGESGKQLYNMLRQPKTTGSCGEALFSALFCPDLPIPLSEGSLSVTSCFHSA